MKILMPRAELEEKYGETLADFMPGPPVCEECGATLERTPGWRNTAEDGPEWTCPKCG